MKELTMPKEIYCEECDLHIRPYLTLEEIMEIGELAVQAENPIEREMTIAMNVMICCTELVAENFQLTETTETDGSDDDILDIGDIILSGVWNIVKENIFNIKMLFDYIAYFESPHIAIARFLNKTLPTIADEYIDKLPQEGEWENIIEKLPTSLIEVLDVAKEDGNADIIRNAIKMNTLDGGDE